MLVLVIGALIGATVGFFLSAHIRADRNVRITQSFHAQDNDPMPDYWENRSNRTNHANGRI